MHSRHHRKHHDDFINRRHRFSLLSSRKLYRSLVTVSTKNSGKTEMILLLGKRKRKNPEKSPLELHQKCQNIMHNVKYCKSLLNTPPRDDYLITLNTMHVISIHLLSLRPTKRATISAQSEQKRGELGL